MVDSSGAVDLRRAYQDAHKAADTDFESHSIHHTLGFGPRQAAPGNHGHDDIVEDYTEQFAGIAGELNLLNESQYQIFRAYTSTTRPAHSEGLTIYETDTDNAYISSMGVWEPIPVMAVNRELRGHLSTTWAANTAKSDAVSFGNFFAGVVPTVTVLYTGTSLIFPLVSGNVISTGFSPGGRHYDNVATSGTFLIHWTAKI